MFKKTITFVDYDGVERTEDFYFNLNRAEVVMLEASMNGGISKFLEKAVAEKNAKAIMEAFKNILRTAYGVKSNDGRRFMKSDEISRDFEETTAYEELFMLLVTDPDEAGRFIKAVMPDMSKDADKLKALEKKYPNGTIPFNK